MAQPIYQIILWLLVSGLSGTYYKLLRPGSNFLLLTTGYYALIFGLFYTSFELNYWLRCRQIYLKFGHAASGLFTTFAYVYVAALVVTVAAGVAKKPHAGR